MKQQIRFAALLLLVHVGCQSPKVGGATANIEDDQDLSIRICGHFQGSSNSSSLDCASTAQSAYSATANRRTSECRGNQTCLNSSIHLLISSPTPPVPASYMQAFITAAHQVEAFMSSKDLRGYQLTLQELAKGAKLIGTTETENLRREYETRFNATTKDKITSLGSAAVSAEHAAFVRKRDTIRILKAINDRYTPVVDQLSGQFLSLVTQYQSLRSIETAAVRLRRQAPTRPRRRSCMSSTLRVASPVRRTGSRLRLRGSAPSSLPEPLSTAMRSHPIAASCKSSTCRHSTSRPTPK
jgi:hypothetical protein